jgi:DNA-binding response OmpR family regulator
MFSRSRVTGDIGIHRVLIVDDDPSIIKFIKTNLDARGYEVLTATAGEEAIRITQKEKPDPLILDIVMPGKVNVDMQNILK